MTRKYTHWSQRYTRDEFIAEIRSLAQPRDKSATQIAEAIGCGVTKNMIIGIVNRTYPPIQLTPKGQAGGRPRAKPLPKRRVVASESGVFRDFSERPTRFAVLDEGVKTFGPIHLLALRLDDGRCRMPLWPDSMGEDGLIGEEAMLYCGLEAVPGQSWCPGCRAKVYRTTAGAQR